MTRTVVLQATIELRRQKLFEPAISEEERNGSHIPVIVHREGPIVYVAEESNIFRRNTLNQPAEVLRGCDLRGDTDTETKPWVAT